MKRGNLRTYHDYNTDTWIIQGKKNGRWVNAWDEERLKRGLEKYLIFNLEYDACGYLQGLIDWLKDQNTLRKKHRPLLKNTVQNFTKSIKTISKNKKRMIKKSKRKNRK